MYLYCAVNVNTVKGRRGTEDFSPYPRRLGKHLRDICSRGRPRQTTGGVVHVRVQ